MAGLVPAIHAVPPRFLLNVATKRRRVDGRDKPGHDGVGFAELSSVSRAH
jgi:hypothetical protein